jgi:hypothetical protein
MQVPLLKAGAIPCGWSGSGGVFRRLVAVGPESVERSSAQNEPSSSG